MKKSLKDYFFTWIIYMMLAWLFVDKFFSIHGERQMENPLIPIIFLLICLKLMKYWLPLLFDIFRLFKKFLSFCWKRDVKTTGAKKNQPQVRYRQPKP